MKRAALAAAALALAVSAPAAAAPSPADLEAELVCPTCETTLDQSSSPVAQRMKAYIRERIAEGASGQQIKDELVEEFGRGVLATPPREGLDLLAWALPLGVLGLGALAVGGLAWTWSKRRGDPPDTGDTLDPELERRVDDELARYES